MQRQRQKGKQVLQLPLSGRAVCSGNFQNNEVSLCYCWYERRASFVFSVKRKQTFPAFLYFAFFFYTLLKNSVLTNNCCKLFPGNFCYFYPTHIFLWTRKHTQYSSSVYLLLPVIPSQL